MFTTITSARRRPAHGDRGGAHGAPRDYTDSAMIPIRDRLPTRRFPVVNYLLIAANVVVFLLELSASSSARAAHLLLQTYGLVPVEVVSFPVHNLFTVFTSMFMHDPTGWLHLGGNMLFLWIFGDNVEDALGHFRYLAFYLLAGIAAAAAQVAISPFSTVPMVGASGAIAGVLAAYASLYPRAAITVLNPIPLLWIFFGLFFDLPAWIVIAEFFVVNLVNGVSSTAQATGGAGGVAFFAHLGGFVAGLFLVRLFMTGPPRSHDPWSGFQPSGRTRAAPAGRRPWDA
jgi:membrane associated rhomboid family serine protease